MKARPILYSAPMVRAVIDGRKSQTRRAVKPQPHWVNLPVMMWNGSVGMIHHHPCPYGKPSDLLWVRENWAAGKGYDGVKPSDIPQGDHVKIHYMADGDKPDWCGVTRPNIFLMQWMSRITQRITGIRVERLQDISEADAIAEGIEEVTARDGTHQGWLNYLHVGDGIGYCTDPRDSYASLWESINDPGSWAANPWVWVIEFENHICNVDEFLKGQSK